MLLPSIVNITVYIVVFTYVFKMRFDVESVGTDQFAIFLMCGLLPWLAFAEMLNQSSSLLTSRAAIISKVAFPVQILPYVSTLVCYLINGLGFFFFLLYLIYSGYMDTTWLFLFVVITMQILFSLGIVAVISSLSVFLKDLAQIMGLIVTIWFYGTPILYPVSMVPESMRSLLYLNPFYYFVESYRSILLKHSFPSDLFVMLLLISVATYLFGGWLFMRIKHAFGDVI